MAADASNCPVCNNPNAELFPAPDAVQVKCIRCGKFELTGSAVAFLPAKLGGGKYKVAVLSHALRRMQAGGQPPSISASELSRLLDDMLPNPHERSRTSSSG